MILLELFFKFFTLGMFSFGGGYAMLPAIKQTVLSNGWITEEEFLNMLGVSQTTPGPISINLATYIGNDIAGIFGALIATFGMIAFSFMLVILISKAIDKFKNNIYVQSVLNSLKPVMLALVLNSFLSLSGEIFLSFKNITIAVVAIILIKRVHPIGLIAIGAILGIIL